ncbi:unnamed protein product [Dicrocoelium dendriticum]|nr:unnamed protein product [Dicrocoelium dendriticum]
MSVGYDRITRKCIYSSESVYKSIKFIADKINFESSHCVIVTSVVTAEFGRSKDVILQFNGSVSNDSCALLKLLEAGKIAKSTLNC